MAVFKCAGKDRYDEDDVPLCDYEAPAPWYCQPCPGCGSRVFNIVKVGAERKRDTARVTAATLAEAPPTVYISTGIEEVDRVLGGGLVGGCTVLISGPRGIGKSTLLMLIANGIAKGVRSTVLYASGEETASQVGKIVQRLGITNDHIEIMGEAWSGDAIAVRIEELKPRLVVIDSLQVVTIDSCEGAEGSPSQISAVINTLTPICQRVGTAAIIVAHMNGQGEIAGGQTAQHLVDTITRFDNEYNDEEEGEPLRILSVEGKNRNGSTTETALFEMADGGVLRPVRKKKSKSRLHLLSNPSIEDE